MLQRTHESLVSGPGIMVNQYEIFDAFAQSQIDADRRTGMPPVVLVQKLVELVLRIEDKQIEVLIERQILAEILTANARVLTVETDRRCLAAGLETVTERAARMVERERRDGYVSEWDLLVKLQLF